MNKEKTIIRVRRSRVKDVKYCACDNVGNPLRGFNKLSDVRKYWEKEIKWGQVELVRELDKAPDMEATNETIKCLKEILKSYGKTKK